MFCERCGNRIEEGAMFCENCGARVNRTIPNISEYVTNEKKQSSNTKVVVIVVVAFIVILALAITGIVFIKKDREKQRAAMEELYNITEKTQESYETEETDEYELPEYEEPEYEYEYEEQEALDNSLDYILYGSDSRYISKSELYGLSATDCRLARNEIYARHGRMFDDDMLQSYFNTKSWYYPSIEPDDFNESMLNKYEKANTQTIAEYEKEQGYR